MGKKSLADKIAELSKPSTEFDIEDNDLRDNVFDHNSDDEHLNSDLSDDETLKKQHYLAVDKSNIRKENDNLNLGKAYGGKVTSRGDLYESDESRSVDEHESSEDSDSGISLTANSESESEEEDEDEVTKEEDSNLTHKRLKLKELMSNERQHIVNRLSQSASNDAVKGFAILQQHKLFDSIIDSRMKVQKSLTNSNVLPIEKEILKEHFATKKTEKYLSQAQEKCFDLLDSILTLRSKLLKKDSVLSSSESVGR